MVIRPRDREDYEDVSLDAPVIPRKQFIRDFANNYAPGQHVTFLGPSGRGKTRLMGQLLIAVSRHDPDEDVVILHGKIKGRDKTIEKLSRAGNFPIVAKWPPSAYSRRIRHRNSRGYILRPLDKPGESVASENKLVAGEYKRAIHQSYHARKRPVIVVVDEAHQTHNDLKLRTECEGPLMRGRPMCAMWSLLQRGRYVSYMVYDQAEHVFIFWDPDKTNQERYSEIGGVDPKQLIELSRKLKTKTVADGSTISQCLYFRRSGNTLSIVDT
jgi:energy-coupling factor transporter ATP-binding protein EcfA2